MTRTSRRPLFDGIRAIVDSSSIPMYFCDPALNVLYCNAHATALLDSNSPLVGHHVTCGLDLITHRVPLYLCSEFCKRQESLNNRMNSGRSPHADEFFLRTIATSSEIRTVGS